MWVKKQTFDLLPDEGDQGITIYFVKVSFSDYNAKIARLDFELLWGNADAIVSTCLPCWLSRCLEYVCILSDTTRK